VSGQLVHGQEMLLCDFGKTAHAKYLPTEDCDVPRNEFKKNSSYLHLLQNIILIYLQVELSQSWHQERFPVHTSGNQMLPILSFFGKRKRLNYKENSYEKHRFNLNASYLI
jgi:hypothetical protein